MGLVLFAILFGAAYGAIQARKRKGNRLDMLQYGAAYAIFFAVFATLASIIIFRMS